MNPDEFLSRATNADSWFDEARSLRVAAKAVWDTFLKYTQDSKQNEESLREAFYLLRNSQLLYALCAECALKGLLIKRFPQDVSISIMVDGKKQVSEATITRIGESLTTTHNLARLAEMADVLPKEAEQTRELLDYCTHCIKWIGRYPVPLKHKVGVQKGRKKPPVFFGHTFLELMDGFLDEVFDEFRR